MFFLPCLWLIWVLPAPPRSSSWGWRGRAEKSCSWKVRNVKKYTSLILVFLLLCFQVRVKLVHLQAEQAEVLNLKRTFCLKNSFRDFYGKRCYLLLCKVLNCCLLVRPQFIHPGKRKNKNKLCSKAICIDKTVLKFPKMILFKNTNKTISINFFIKPNLTFLAAPPLTRIASSFPPCCSSSSSSIHPPPPLLPQEWGEQQGHASPIPIVHQIIYYLRLFSKIFF